jgi:hypothetical protein
MVIWYFMQMSSILCMFEETKNCQVVYMFVLETKKCWIFSLYFEKPGMFQVYLMFIWGNTKCQLLYVFIQEPTIVEYFSCVVWETTKCPILYAYPRNHKCGVFYGNVNYFMHIQEHTKCWLCYISIQEIMNAEYLM